MSVRQRRRTGSAPRPTHDLADPFGPTYHGALTERRQLPGPDAVLPCSGPTAGATPAATQGARPHLRRHPAVCARDPGTGDGCQFGPGPTRTAAPGGGAHARSECSATGDPRREEILAALGWASMTRKAHGRAQGVAWAPGDDNDAELLVNLRKTERGLLAHHHVPGLHAVTATTSTGSRRTPPRWRPRSGSVTCTTVSGAPTWRCSSARRRATISGRERPSSSSGCATTWSTVVSAPSPSPGGCGGRCRRRPSWRHGSSRRDGVPGDITCA